jgi:hypothetical protein
MQPHGAYSTHGCILCSHVLYIAKMDVYDASAWCTSHTLMYMVQSRAVSCKKWFFMMLQPHGASSTHGCLQCNHMLSIPKVAVYDATTWCQFHMDLYAETTCCFPHPWMHMVRSRGVIPHGFIAKSPTAAPYPTYLSASVREGSA